MVIKDFKLHEVECLERLCNENDNKKRETWEDDDAKIYI